MPLLPLLALTLASTPQRLVVLDVRPLTQVSTERLQIIQDVVVNAVREQANGMSVIGSDEIRGMLELQKQKMRLGCADVSCLAEIAGALGADLGVSTTLAALDSSYRVSVQLVDSRRSIVLGSAESTSIGKGDADVIDAAKSAVRVLFHRISTTSGPGTQPVRPARASVQPLALSTAEPAQPRSNIAPWALTIGGGAVAATGAVLGVTALSIWSGDHPQTLNGLTEHSLSASQASTANALATTSVILLPLGVAAAVGGITWLLTR